ncbi:hypothetical protein BBD32_12430 [Elizabethkingia anophelis]|uniref:Transposase n=1 Tax=Elizabethkingia anophelis TaxID=1117645 RepID=A0AAU8UYF3_9FLAO|nr:hypothetical protein [Elizabethkingia anophelis]AQX02212.1 hypothetical protein BBD32_12430 [Elizabethkingia anophelis]OPB61685.1 hypothetical protein BAY11_17505 [Elizabethkingia anophelis]
MKGIRDQLSDCTLFVDKGYLCPEKQSDLFNYAHIELETPKRVNQKDYKPQFYLFKKRRKRIKILFFQLCDQFMIARNYLNAQWAIFNLFVINVLKEKIKIFYFFVRNLEIWRL